MNFIEHPSYSKQIHDINEILSKVTLDNLNKLVERFEYECISFERLQTSGRINFIFNLKIQSKISSSIEWILKVANPHPYWKECRIKNEVFTMQYLYKHTTIPVPKIIDYSDHIQTSILSSEYILMEKIYGNTLESIIEIISNQTLINITIELFDYVKQLREITLPNMNQIGSFTSKDMSLGGTIEDGPTLGPFYTLKEYIIEHLHWIIRRIQTDDELFLKAKHLIFSLEKIIHHAQSDPNLSNLQLKYHLTHTDLNSSNILIDENNGKILAILDWESCAMTFNNNDLEFFDNCFDDNNPRKQQIIQHQSFNDISDMKNIKYYLDIFYPAMYATFYSATWFEIDQTVHQHIEQYLKETEDSITAFNSYIFKK